MQYIMAEVQANRYSRLPNKSADHLSKKGKKYHLICTYSELVYAYWFSAKLLSVIYFYYFLRKFSTYTFIQNWSYIRKSRAESPAETIWGSNRKWTSWRMFLWGNRSIIFFSFWNPYSRDAKRLLSGRFLRVKVIVC